VTCEEFAGWLRKRKASLIQSRDHKRTDAISTPRAHIQHDFLAPPQADQLEVTLIGPGYGECAVVHIGNGEWIVMDSCVNVHTGRAMALEYFETLGVPLSSVRMVLLSHWHDDHIRGITEILERCSAATIACPAAIGENQVREFIRAQALLRSQRTTSGADEIAAALSVIKARAKTNQVQFAQGTARLLMVPRDTPWNCEVWSLSPSAAEYARFISSLGRLMPKSGGTMQRLPAPQPNDLAVAAWLRVHNPGGSEINLLFGSDLEEDGNPATGWSAVVSSSTRPTGMASVFKVAHHGSITGHHDGVWSTMLRVAPWAILTPFQTGQMLPTKSDLRRIYGMAPQSYVSSDPTVRQRPSKVSSVVDKTLKSMGVELVPDQLPPGRITLRNRGLATMDEWEVNLGGAARSLRQVLDGLESEPAT